MHTSLKARLRAFAMMLGSGALLAAAPAWAKPDAGIEALSRLSEAELDTSQGAGLAFLTSLFPDPSTHCGKLDGSKLPFQAVCNWYPDPQSDEIWPSLMIAINKGRIVSVITAAQSQLSPAIWTCEKDIPAGQIGACYPKSISAGTRKRWTKAWEQYLNSAN